MFEMTGGFSFVNFKLNIVIFSDSERSYTPC